MNIPRDLHLRLQKLREARLRDEPLALEHSAAEHEPEPLRHVARVRVYSARRGDLREVAHR